MIRLSLLLVLSVAAACGGDDPKAVDATISIDTSVPIDAGPPREVHMSTRTLRGGEIHEAAMVGGANDLAIIRLTATVSELDWNIHAHPNNEIVTVHEELNQMMVLYEFVPTAQAEWYLLLRNSSPNPIDVQIEVGLYGAMTFEFI
jgi:hypothetical protein